MTGARRLSLAFVALAACTPFRPPFTQPEGASTPPDPRQAEVVFLWPSTSCDPAGHLTLATTDGQFVGNLSRGARLSVLVPPGPHTFLAWNDVMEAAHVGGRPENVLVLNADLQEGHMYYARIVFGQWDRNGPTRGGARDGTLVVGRNHYYSNRCVGTAYAVTGAMVAVSPASDDWARVPEWLGELEPFVPDHASGQAWLDADRAQLAAHVALAQLRFAQLTLEGKKLATIDATDAVPTR